MKIRRELQFYILIALIVITIPFLLFKNPNWLGLSFIRSTELISFSNYFSGITAPFLGILNLVVLVRLTLSISDHDNDRMLTQLRYDAYKDIASKLNSINKENYTLEKLNSTYYHLENYALNNFFLLDGENYTILTNIHLKLWTITCKLKFALEDFENRDDKGKLYNTQEYINDLERDLNDWFINFDVTKFEMLSFLEKIVSKKSVKNFKDHYLKSA